MIEFSTGRIKVHENGVTFELDPATVREITKYITGDIPGLKEFRILIDTEPPPPKDDMKTFSLLDP
jgi:hypothetical protein